MPGALARAGIPLCVLVNGMIAAVIGDPLSSRSPFIALAACRGLPAFAIDPLGCRAAKAIGLPDEDTIRVTAALWGSRVNGRPISGRALAIRRELWAMATTAPFDPES